MDEIGILSAYVSKPRQLKKIDGIMTPVYLKPYDKKFNYTKRFIQFNNTLLKQGLTNTIVYDDNSLIYNREKNIFEKKSKYFKKKRKKEDIDPWYQFIDNVKQINPVIQQLNSEGVLYTYAANFRGGSGHGFVYKLKVILRQYQGQRIMIKARLPWDGWEKVITLDIPIFNNNTKYTDWYNQEAPWRKFEMSSGEYIFDKQFNEVETGYLTWDVRSADEQARMRIFIINNINPERYDQAFADGSVSHCVLQPIRDYLEFRIDKAKNKETSTILKYNAAMNKLKKWEGKYPVGRGIPMDKLNKFCVETGFGIDLYLPDARCEGRKWKTYRPPKNPTKIFKFLNTRHNHLNITAQLDNNFRETIDKETYDKLLIELSNDDKYYVYNEFCIITQEKHYSLESEYNVIANDFEKINGLKRYRLDDLNPKQKLMNDFIAKSCLYNATVDFKDTFMYRFPRITCEEDFERLQEYYGVQFDLMLGSPKSENEFMEKWERVIHRQLKKDNVKQIDMSKAYTRCGSCSWFTGYPAKLTDLRVCNDIMGVGFYVIKNIKGLSTHLKNLGVYYENNIYPSPELKFIKSLGVSFDIVAGCWGTTCDIDWGEEKGETGEYTGMYKKTGGVRNYARWFGCALKKTPYTQYRYNTDNIDYIKNWKYATCDSENDYCDIRYTEGDFNDIEGYKNDYTVLMNIPKQNIYHQTHIASFIYSYMRIMMIEQLLNIPIDNIVRVAVDGIYYTDCDFKINKNFETDKDLRFGNCAGVGYRNSEEWVDFSGFGENKEFNKIEVWTGPGGCGKTHINLIDKGHTDVMYIAHSWKLSAAKRTEFPGLDVSVVARLTMDDWYIDGKKTNYWEAIANKYSVLIIDEISTLSEWSKRKIIERFPNHKLIFCGDIGLYKGKTIMYQCPPIFNIIGDCPFIIEKEYKLIRLNENRRCKCKKLKRLLKLLRKIIENEAGRRKGELSSWIERELDVIDKNNIDYKPEDMILSRRHCFNEFYDDKFKTLEKYYVVEKQLKPGFSANGKVRDANIYNGQIFLEKPDIPESKTLWKNPSSGNKYKYRHGYTIDCIQGETAEFNLYIDINELSSSQHLYTAISRSRYFKQIYFIK